ncbi:MAG: Holliday junction resolvase RuvX [bacterium]|nr:Holliday junction resolvase RuvX [bacterium]
MTDNPPQKTFPDTGRIVGVDFGLARIGLAITDPGRIFCSPLEVYQPKSEQRDEAYFQQLTREERVVAFVVGLPIHISGRESEMSTKSRAFGRWLQEATDRPVRFQDERYTSSHAERHLQSAGLTSKKRKQRRDMLAAQILLQAFVDSGGHDDEILPLED